MGKKVLIFTNSSGGLCSFRYELIKELIDTDNEVYSSMPFDGKHDILQEIGCNCIETNISRRGINPIKDLGVLIKYIKLVKQIKPDIVLCYTIKPNVYGGLACQITKVPYVCNITGLGTAIENGGLLQKIALMLYKIGLKKAQKVFFQNSQNQEFMVSNKVVQVENELLPGSGVNLTAHPFEDYPPKRDNVTFLTIGRIMKSKGIEELLTAIKKLKSQYPPIKFQFVGGYDGNYKDQIENAVNDGLIEYFGYQTDVHSFIKECDAVLNASHHEGMSNVALEAASSGRPIVSSNASGCRETFDDGISGISFNVKDPIDLERAIKDFLELPYEKRVSMGKAGRYKVEKEFDRNIVVKKYIEEINKI